MALARDGMAFVSAHIGDLGSLESRAAQARAADQLVRFHQATPELVVADRHPAYASRAWAASTAADLGVPLHEVQHHHAHLASLAAEHGRLDEPILGVVFDGTGYGCDAGVWGGELLILGDGGLSAERVAHLGTVRLAGGDEGVRNPARTAALALLAAGVDPEATPVGEVLSEIELAFARKQHASGAGWVPTSSVGRLFDVVAAVLGIRGRVTYEAQAAIELEATARRAQAQGCDLGGRLVMPALDPDPLVRGLVDALRSGEPVEVLAWGFHVTLAHAAADLAVDEARAHDVATVGLTGGVFANRLLLGLMRRRLTDAGMEVLTHRLVPANDGGLSLGQVAIGARLQHVRNHGPGNPGK